jgi:hypothetical protein
MKRSNLFHVGCAETDGAEFINVKLQKRVAGTLENKGKIFSLKNGRQN